MVRKNSGTGKQVLITFSVIAVAVFLILLATGVINLKSNKLLSIGDVPSGCNIYGSGTTNNEFTCPSTCDVNGWNTCQEQTGDIATVVFRTNASSLSDYGLKKGAVWIAVNGLVSGNSWVSTKELHLYCSVTNTNYGTGSFRYGKVEPPTGKAWPFNPTIYVKPSSYGSIPGFYVEYGTANTQTSGLQTTYRQYYLCDSGSYPESVVQQATKVVSLDPYKSKNQEVYSGSTNAFLCNVPWGIKSSSGATLDAGTATYSGAGSGDYQTGVKRLNSGEKFLFNGKINYAIIDASKACAIDICNDGNSGIIKCVSSGGCQVKDDKVTMCDQGTFCVQSATGASCLSPFSSDVDYSEGVSLSDSITFKYSLSSDTQKSAIVTFKLLDTRDKTKILQIFGPSTISLPDTKTLIFNNPGLIGTYQIIVEKVYNGITLDPEIYEVRVGNPLELVVKIPYSPLTSTNLLTNSPIYVDVIASENGVPTTDLISVDMKATLKTSNGQTTALTIPDPVKIDNSFRYIFTINQPGLFEVTTTANKFGIQSNEIVRDAEIREQKIDIQYTNIGLVKNSKPGLITVKFETKDPFGNYLPVNYNVKIIPSGASTGSGDIDVTSSVTGSDGVYQFAYNFVRGTYIIQIDATATGYTVQSSEKSPAINIDETAVTVECSLSSDCSAGYICNSSGQCVKKDQPFLLYAIIILAIIFIIVLVVIIANLSKKKNKNKPVNLGVGL